MYFKLCINKIKLLPFKLLKQGQGLVEYAFIIAFVVIVAAGFLSGTNPISEKVSNIFASLNKLVHAAMN